MKSYEVEVIVSVELDDDSDEETAYQLVADIMQAHHEDSLRPRDGHKWDYTMLQGCVADVTGQV